jgi:hypothetical protein
MNNYTINKTNIWKIRDSRREKSRNASGIKCIRNSKIIFDYKKYSMLRII